MNEYVADFVANMNPLGVLCARDVMEPATATPRQTVPPETDIRDVMALFGPGDTAVGVAQDGAVIGQITRDRVLQKLLDPRA